MNEINKEEYIQKCIEMNTAQSLAQRLETELEIAITDLFIRNSGKFVIMKLSKGKYNKIYKFFTNKEYNNFLTKNEMVYLGMVDYFENVPSSEKENEPDTIGFRYNKETTILTSTYAEDLEYGLYIYSTKPYNGNELLTDIPLFRINFSDPDILDSIIFFDTDYEAKLFLEVS